MGTSSYLKQKGMTGVHSNSLDWNDEKTSRKFVMETNRVAKKSPLPVVAL